MHIRKRYILVFLLAIGALIWHWHADAVKTEEDHHFNLSMQQLRGVTKLVIWEQDFSLNDLESQERTYFSWITTRESLSTTVNGKMGFHIDLADSNHTSIQRYKDTVIVKAPLQITYVSLDLTTLQQVREASVDPTIHIDQNEVIRHLSQKALEKYLPQVIEAVKTHQLTNQQNHLSKLIGAPVKIVLTQMPTVSSWKE